MAVLAQGAGGVEVGSVYLYGVEVFVYHGDALVAVGVVAPYHAGLIAVGAVHRGPGGAYARACY